MPFTTSHPDHYFQSQPDSSNFKLPSEKVPAPFISVDGKMTIR